MDKEQLFPIQVGESLSCDFDENTWTFRMPKGFCWTGGKFAIVPIETFDDMCSRQPAVSGEVPYQKCPVCNGYGEVQPNWNRGATSPVWVPCDVCKGAKIIRMAGNDRK
jgi:hypothetical protein